MAKFVEMGTVILPEHLVAGLGIGRDKCEVLVYEEGGLSEEVLLQCSPRNKKTIHSCRADYQLGDFPVIGCPLRNTGKDYKHPLYFAEKNIGLKLEREKEGDSTSGVE